MKKIVLKSEACIGCGACVGIDSEHFEFSDEGYSIIKSQENLDSPILMDAIDACPVAIISLEETEGSFDQVENQNCQCEEHDCNCNSDTCQCVDMDCHCNDEDNIDMEEAT